MLHKLRSHPLESDLYYTMSGSKMSSHNVLERVQKNQKRQFSSVAPIKQSNAHRGLEHCQCSPNILLVTMFVVVDREETLPIHNVSGRDLPSVYYSIDVHPYFKSVYCVQSQLSSLKETWHTLAGSHSRVGEYRTSPESSHCLWSKMT